MAAKPTPSATVDANILRNFIFILTKHLLSGKYGDYAVVPCHQTVVLLHAVILKHAHVKSEPFGAACRSPQPCGRALLRHSDTRSRKRAVSRPVPPGGVGKLIHRRRRVLTMNTVAVGEEATEAAHTRDAIRRRPRRPRCSLGSSISMWADSWASSPAGTRHTPSAASNTTHPAVGLHIVGKSALRVTAKIPSVHAPAPEWSCPSGKGLTVVLCDRESFS